MSRKIKHEDLSKTIICHENESAVEVAKILRDTGSRHLLVLSKDEKPLGIISTVDINNRVVAAQKDPLKLKAADIMTKEIITVPSSSELMDALQKMSDKNITFVPVVDSHHKLLGVLDFTKSLKLLCEVEKEAKHRG